MMIKKKNLSEQITSVDFGILVFSVNEFYYMKISSWQGARWHKSTQPGKGTGSRPTGRLCEVSNLLLWTKQIKLRALHSLRFAATVAFCHACTLAAVRQYPALPGVLSSHLTGPVWLWALGTDLRECWAQPFILHSVVWEQWAVLCELSEFIAHVKMKLQFCRTLTSWSPRCCLSSLLCVSLLHAVAG